jgi:hypothetical protein
MRLGRTIGTTVKEKPILGGQAASRDAFLHANSVLEKVDESKPPTVLGTNNINNSKSLAQKTWKETTKTTYQVTKMNAYTEMSYLQKNGDEDVKTDEIGNTYTNIEFSDQEEDNKMSETMDSKGSYYDVED